MRKLLIVLLLFISGVMFSQATVELNRMDVKEYNSTLRIWQKTTNAEKDYYTIKLDMERRSLEIIRSSNNTHMLIVDVRTFRGEKDFFIFSGFMVNEKGNKYPCSGEIHQFKLIVNLGDYIYEFYKVEEKDYKI